MKIWRLENDLDNYDYLVLENESDWEMINDTYEFNGKRISGIWNPIEVVAYVDTKIGDSLYLFPGGPIFSERAVEVLKEFLEDRAEILPIKYNKGSFYVINITNVIQAVDIDKSKVVRFPSSGRIMKFESIAFFKEKLDNQPIFKISELPRTQVFVSDSFRESVINNNLTGFKFTEVWESRN